MARPEICKQVLRIPSLIVQSRFKIVMERLISGLSERERDRRYSLVRKEMKRSSIDCLIITGYSGRWNEMNANVRYVSNYADNLSTVSYVLFPLEGEPIYIMQMTLKRSAAMISWIKDMRPESTAKAPQIMEERLSNVGLHSGHVGLVGAGFTDGEVIGMPYNIFQELTRRLPNIELVEMTETFTRLRMIKGEEELRLIRKSAELCDLAFEEGVRLARPGIRENEWFAGIHRLLYAHGCEQPSFLIGASGPMPTDNPSLMKNDPIYSSRVVKPGDVIISEFGPKVDGYAAQSLQMICLRPAEPFLRTMAKYTVDIYKKVESELGPRKNVGEILQVGQSFMREVEPQLGAQAQALTPIIHLIGMGGPDPSPSNACEGMELEKGMTLMIEVGNMSQQPVYSWLGTAFEITDTGSKSLTRIAYEDRALKVV